MRKAAAGQHDAAFGMDADGPSVAFDDGAAHRAVSTISSRTGDDSHNGIFRSNADFASRPASALPLVSVMPRPWRITSMKCFDSRFAT
jgi:hypothetical protein